mmetsp:Transcript_17562/g.48182  ORF Transcript_17562/g.48182 Transcript_17562/m.48182 type:complete len:431 (+) Transcript_17562:747-2039(+)
MVGRLALLVPRHGPRSDEARQVAGDLVVLQEGLMTRELLQHFGVAVFRSLGHRIEMLFVAPDLATAEEHDDVSNALRFEAVPGLFELALDSEDSAMLALDEVDVLVGLAGHRSLWGLVVKPEALDRQLTVQAFHRLLQRAGHQSLSFGLEPVLFQVGEGLVRRVADEHHIFLLPGDEAEVLHDTELQDLCPVLLPEQDDRQSALDLARRHEHKHLEEFVARAITARCDDQPDAPVSHPELPREEIMELEAELRRDEGVQAFLEWQRDAEAHRSAASSPGALVRGLHHAWASPRTNGVRGQARLLPLQRVFSDEARELHRFLVVLAEERHALQTHELRSQARILGHLLSQLSHRNTIRIRVFGARGAEDHDDAVDALLSKSHPRLLKLALDTEESSMRPVQELLVFVCLRRLWCLHRALACLLHGNRWTYL